MRLAQGFVGVVEPGSGFEEFAGFGALQSAYEAVTLHEVDEVAVRP